MVPMNNIVDGKKIARRLVSRMRKQIENIDRKPVLGLVMVGGDSVTDSYVWIKEKTAKKVGIDFVKLELDQSVTTDELIEHMTVFSQTVDGLVVQLPLPDHIDRDRVVVSIPMERDVDALNPENSLVLGPVALSVLEIIDHHEIDLSGKNIVVVGQGNLVGVPVVVALKERGVEPQVVDRETDQDEIDQTLMQADIIISGVGVPGLIGPDQIKEGVILIDAGTSSSEGSVLGDIDAQCAGKASLFSTTPGGIGPITIAKLFENTIRLYTR